jgi:hypothetical protein
MFNDVMRYLRRHENGTKSELEPRKHRWEGLTSIYLELFLHFLFNVDMH